MIKTESLPKIQPYLGEEESINPLKHDAYRMGQDVGANVMLMLENFDFEHCSYFIIVDRKTGERLKVMFEYEE